MDCKKIGLKETRRFSKLFLDYIAQSNADLKDFYNQYPNIENFEKQIGEKYFSAKQRRLLVEVLDRQYKDIEISDRVKTNIRLLEESNTYTVTTGHQLNIFTGPLYFIFKIATVVKTCQVLAERYTDYNFVPVYWMASEDHDFDEIDHFFSEGKRYQWKTDQKGAVGRFDTSDISELIDSIPGLPDFFKDAYLKNKTLAEAGREYVNYLFGEYGCVVVDADNAQLKKSFASVIKDDVINHSAKALVEEATIAIESLGYKTQVHARDINFFYLKDDVRERLEKSGAKYEVLETDYRFTYEQLLEEIENHTERFSPNVILRPLYQEWILPNLAYVGGPSEVAYWFQLKKVFDHYKCAFPILMPRNFGVIVNGPLQRKAAKTNLDWVEFFKEQSELERQVALNHSTEEVLMNGKMEELEKLFLEVKKQAAAIDQTLVPHVEAKLAKTINTLEVIEKKFVRAEKKKQADKIRQVEEVLHKLFPGGTLQERKENFLPFFLDNPNLISDLIECFEPLDFQFHILLEGGH